MQYNDLQSLLCATLQVSKCVGLYLLRVSDQQSVGSSPGFDTCDLKLSALPARVLMDDTQAFYYTYYVFVSFILPCIFLFVVLCKCRSVIKSN